MGAVGDFADGALTPVAIDGAWYVAQASMTDEAVMPLTEAPDKAPYFAMIVVPGRGVRR